MTVAQLVGQEAMVLEILQDVEETRSDDFLLYAEVLERFYPELIMIPVQNFLVAHLEIGAPSYDSITRARRKVQRKYPEYESERAKKRRQQQESVYREYARAE